MRLRTRYICLGLTLFWLASLIFLLWILKHLVQATATHPDFVVGFFGGAVWSWITAKVMSVLSDYIKELGEWWPRPD